MCKLFSVGLKFSIVLFREWICFSFIIVYMLMVILRGGGYIFNFVVIIYLFKDFFFGFLDV